MSEGKLNPPLAGSDLPLKARLRKMHGMGDHQLAALMDGVGPKAADEIDRLEALVANQQATIDALMLEFCPDEMSEEQRERWARNQRKSSVQIDAPKGRA